MDNRHQLTDNERNELAIELEQLLDIFEAAGGRGVEIADRIDEIRAILEPEEDEFSA